MPSAGPAGPVAPRGDRPGCRLPGSRGRGSVAAENLAAWGDRLRGAVGVEDELPAEAVDADLVVIVAQQDEVSQAGLTAFGPGDDVVDLAGGRGLVAAAGPSAVPVPEDDRAADVLGDVLGVSDVQRQARRVVWRAEDAGAQVGGEAVGAGHGVGSHRQQGPT